MTVWMGYASVAPPFAKTITNSWLRNSGHCSALQASTHTHKEQLKSRCSRLNSCSAIWCECGRMLALHWTNLLPHYCTHDSGLCHNNIVSGGCGACFFLGTGLSLQRLLREEKSKEKCCFEASACCSCMTIEVIILL